MTTRRHSQFGFSLLEMLVALSLLALITVMITSSIRLSSQSLARVDDRSHALKLASRQQFLHTLFGKASFALRTHNNDRPMSQFFGQKDSVTFITNLPSWLPLSGPVRMHLELTPGQNSDLNHLQVRLDNASLVNPENAQHIIVENIAGLSFRYYGQAKSELITDWHDRFDNPEILPPLVEIGITFPEGDDRIWPKTIARVSQY